MFHKMIYSVTHAITQSAEGAKKKKRHRTTIAEENPFNMPSYLRNQAFITH